MSFMYNPFPYDDPRAVNRPALPKKTVGAVVAGTSKAAAALAGEIASRLKAAPGKNVVVGFDGYATADWTRMVNLLSQQLLGKGIGVDVAAFTEVLKSEREIADMINPNLEWDTSKDPSPDRARLRGSVRRVEIRGVQTAPRGAPGPCCRRTCAVGLRQRMPGRGGARTL
jgi:hypothetical protein